MEVNSYLQLEKVVDNFAKDFMDYVLSGHAMLAVSTYEKDRAIQEIRKAAKPAKRRVFSWSVATGWVVDAEGTLLSDKPETQPDQAIAEIASHEEENSIWILRDFGIYLNKDTFGEFDIVISLLDNLRQSLCHDGKTIVFLGPGFKSPDVLKQDIALMDFSLPRPEDIEKHIKFVCEKVTVEDGSKFELNKDMIPDITYACRGMTQQQIFDRVALALRKHKNLTLEAVQTIINEKGAVIRASGILDFTEPPKGGLDVVGGYEALKRQVRLDKPCFSEEAKEFGIDFPKGLLLVGLSGCGKTLIATAIASEFGMPLISMDVGSLMDSLVGGSEKNMREAIQILESVAPCVCLLDEIEKAFGGQGDHDGGSSKRVFSTYLKWLNDHTSPVYVVATANQIQSLPPELSRKGRFDEIFGLDLPSEEEREQIFCIHLTKRKRSLDDYSCSELAKQSKCFTGADVEQAVKQGLKTAFCEGRETKQSDFEKAIKSVVPLSKTNPEQIRLIQEWCNTHAKQANPKVLPKQEPKKRRVSVSA